ncbi:MAG TPA: hypothetical protein VMX16_17500 [Terriglobia bacterium]|nr:hypothetical protein [Terriglobia bacterium]
MTTKKPMDRRRFLQDSALCLGAGTWMGGGSHSVNSENSAAGAGIPAGGEARDLQMKASFSIGKSVWIVRPPDSGFQLEFASREMARGLRNLGLAREPIEATVGAATPSSGDFVFTLSVDRNKFQNPEAYEIAQQDASRLSLTGATPQAVLYAAFDILERQGAFFGLDGEVYPLDPAKSLNLPSIGNSWQGQPRFKVRGLVPWPDFLNCVTVYNREDWRAYLEAMVRMRFNTLGVHVYSGADQWTESFLSFEYAGAGHLAYTDTSATNRWGYLPERTSRFGMGSPEFYADEVFGSEATTRAKSCWEDEEFAQQLWAEAFRYAKQLGIRTGVGFEPYQIPDEIFRAAPPEAHYVPKNPNIPGPRIDPESTAAKDILEARLGRLLQAYPTVDYVWLWEDEQMNWASQKGNVPLSVTPFKQAHDFLKRHAPEKRMVLSGWGGVVRHFAYFHKALPEDVIFSSLNDNLGWDPVSEEYGKLEGRERWPIPWLEDDPAMWLPQFHVRRFVRDMDLAEKYGCQGLMGIHWRHRIMDADAGFQSRYSWQKDLTPTQFFQAFSSVQAREPRANSLAKVLDDTDRDRLILCSWDGQIKDGHHETHEYTGDYDEAFQFWNGYEPPESIKQSQAQVARQLRGLADSASSLTERERLNYLAGFVEFLTPYSESWSLAFHLNEKLKNAAELKKQGKPDEAKTLIRSEGVPLWLKLAPRVRQVFLGYQGIVSTRNDQGQLASMHNKYERLALYRLRASMKEFLGELPPEVEQLFSQVRQPDPNAAPRLFVPTRPTLLGSGDRVRVHAVLPGRGEVAAVSLITRAGESSPWTPSRMNRTGRRTFVAELEYRKTASPLLDYYVAATCHVGGEERVLSAPLEAPARFYTVTLV